MIHVYVCVQEARLAECEKMLVAIDLATGLNDGSIVVHAVGNCYSLLAPVIFHQIAYHPVVQVHKFSVGPNIISKRATFLKKNIYIKVSNNVCLCLYLSFDIQVLKKCLIALENNSSHLKRTMCTEPTMNMIASITYYLSKVCQHLSCLYCPVDLVTVMLGMLMPLLFHLFKYSMLMKETH